MSDKNVDLDTAECKNCAADTAALTTKEREQYVARLDSNWRLATDYKSISRCFKFKNYYETIAFVNMAAMVAHQQDHHPDMNVSYNTCSITYSTHSIGGLSLNDFICAAKTDLTLNL